MSVIVILKFLHFLAIIFAGGIVIGGAVIQRAHMKAGEAPSEPVRKALRTLAGMGLAALSLLWITGIGLAHGLYGGLSVNTAFSVKLAGAGLLLFLSAFGNYHLYQVAQRKQPPNARLMGGITSLSRLALIVVLGAVSVAFTA